ncbi:MAG: RNA polymerase sigma factor [Bacteroidales bacterium]|nr:RNA polymerase sigma factor [Bacteroidales bacterium]
MKKVILSGQPVAFTLRQNQYNKMMYSEEAIIEGCLKHKHKAQKMLFNQYFGLMMGICLRYSASKSEAEEILLKGFYTIFAKIGQYENRGSFVGWMQRIMVNTAIDYYRKIKAEKKHEVISLAEMDESSINAQPNTDHFTTEKILETLKKLPDGYRIVFNMYAIEGYSHKEIAEQLGVSVNTTKTQLLKARKYLQRLLLELDENFNQE